jgi:hypothetical protein
MFAKPDLMAVAVVEVDLGELTAKARGCKVGMAACVGLGKTEFGRHDLSEFGGVQRRVEVIKHQAFDRSRIHGARLDPLTTKRRDQRAAQFPTVLEQFEQFLAVESHETFAGEARKNSAE